MNKKILIGTSSFGKLDSSPIDLIRNAGFEIIMNPFGHKLTKSELMELLPDIDGIVAGLETLDREVLEKFDLKVISRCGSGISNVDINAVKDLGIKFYYTPDGPTQAVAELTIGMMLSLLRNAFEMASDLKKRKWTKHVGFQLKGKTVLLIGFGKIGQRVMDMLKPFALKFLVVDPAIKDIQKDYRILDIKDALPLADIISLHASGDKCILGENEFSLMKQGVLILNAARGGLIDETVLKKFLDNNKVSGAWLDSFSEEPYSGELCDDIRVVLTPHIGSYTKEGRLSMELKAAENLLNGFELIR